MIINNFIKKKLFVLLLIFVTSISAQEKKLTWKNEDFEAYLTSKNIVFKNKADGSVYSDSIKDLYKQYFLDFVKYNMKLQLEANPYLKVNEVYAVYNNPGSIDLVVYTDEETVCLQRFMIDGEFLSFPENGVVKILKPIRVRQFGFFKIEENNLILQNKYYSSSQVRYNYLSGTVKNDTIQFTKKYWSKNLHSFEKSKWSSVKKVDFKMIHQPGLKAEKYYYEILYYKVTGEFYLEALKDKW